MHKISAAALVGGGILVASITAWLTHAFYQRVPKAFFDGGPFSIWLTMMSTAALLFGAWHALQTYRQSEQAEVSTRFQKGAELLSSDKEATVISGIAVLQSAATAAPKAYVGAALQTLTIFVQTGSFESGLESGYLDFNGSVRPDFRWPRSDTATAAAFTAIGELSQAEALRPRDLVRADKLTISPLYIADKFVRGQFQDFSIARMMLNRVVFEDCDFSRSDLEGAIGHKVIFRRCNLTNANLKFEERKGAGTDDWADQDVVEFQECSGVETASYNGASLASWINEIKARHLSRRLVRGLAARKPEQQGL